MEPTPTRHRIPWLTLGAAALILIAWLVSLARGADAWAPTAVDLIRAGGSGGEGARAGWRLLTAWTVHAGVLHVGFDMSLLILVGVPLERRAGRTITALTILGGAIVAAAVSRWWNPYVLTVGASGAAFALAAGLVVRLARPTAGPRRRAVVALIVFAVANLVAAVLAPAVDHPAHLGGALAGIAIGALIEVRRIGPGLAIAAIAGLAIATAVAAPAPRDVGATLEAIDRIELRYRELITARAAGRRSDRAADAALARAIRTEVADPLAALAGELADDTEMPGRLRGRLAAARQYLAARSEGLALYVEYLETGETALRDRIVQADHAVDAALERLARQ